MLAAPRTYQGAAYSTAQHPWRHQNWHFQAALAAHLPPNHHFWLHSWRRPALAASSYLSPQAQSARTLALAALTARAAGSFLARADRCRWQGRGRYVGLARPVERLILRG